MSKLKSLLLAIIGGIIALALITLCGCDHRRKPDNGPVEGTYRLIDGTQSILI